MLQEAQLHSAITMAMFGQSNTILQEARFGTRQSAEAVMISELESPLIHRETFMLQDIQIHPAQEITISGQSNIKTAS
jgi:hypothetical protein